MMIEVKRIVFDDSGSVKEIEFYPGTDLAVAMKRVVELKLTSHASFDREQAIEQYLSNVPLEPPTIRSN